MSARYEFCGVPAAGKSTLYAAALPLVRQRGAAISEREQAVSAALRRRDFGRIGNLLAALTPGWRREFLGRPHGLNDWHRFAVRHPHFVAQIHEWLAAEGADDAWRDGVFYAVLTTAFEHELIAELNVPTLLDEGWGQRFFTLRGYRGLGRDGDAARYVALMPRPGALVWVDTPPDICAARLRKRAQLPILLQSESDAMLVTRLREGAARLSELFAACEQAGIPALRVDGSGDIAADARTIADFASAKIAEVR